MYELNVRREFSAAHFLRGYDGKCSALHGHNWGVTVFIRAKELDPIGLSVDFTLLKKELDSLLSEVDHKMLNELPVFREMNPTSENIARFFYKRLAEKLNSENVRMHRVLVSEGASSGAAYFEEE